MDIKLSEKSLENLAIAILKLEDSRGLKIALFPDHVLQDWILKQMPDIKGAMNKMFTRG